MSLISTLDCEVIRMQASSGEYQGMFAPNIHRIIEDLVKDEYALHLFSGSSLIGDIRVDKAHPNATHNIDVAQFIEECDSDFDWVILDPPYAIHNPEIKLSDCDDTTPLSASVPLRRKVKLFLQRHARNVLWLDMAAPIFTGFERVKLWLCLPGGYHHVRVLSWLHKTMQIML